MFMLMIELMIGVVGATFSAGIGQMALSHKSEQYKVQFMVCLALFIISMLIVLISSKSICSNQIDFVCMVLVTLIPICFMANMGREKGLALRMK